jgi:acid stress-induced BolA-like protein IbaG/YrbA
MEPDDIAALIRASLPEAQVRVVSEDNTHYEAVVVSAGFAGKSQVARHQMVYRALGERMGREIHALALKTLTPGELADG